MLERIEHAAGRAVVHAGVRKALDRIVIAPSIARLLGGGMSPIFLRAVITAVLTDERLHAVRVGRIADIRIGQIVPIPQYLVITAALLQKLKKLTVQRDKFRT